MNIQESNLLMGSMDALSNDLLRRKMMQQQNDLEQQKFGIEGRSLDLRAQEQANNNSYRTAALGEEKRHHGALEDQASSQGDLAQQLADQKAKHDAATEALGKDKAMSGFFNVFSKGVAAGELDPTMASKAWANIPPEHLDNPALLYFQQRAAAGENIFPLTSPDKKYRPPAYVATEKYLSQLQSDLDEATQSGDDDQIPILQDKIKRTTAFLEKTGTEKQPYDTETTSVMDPNDPNKTVRTTRHLPMGRAGLDQGQSGRVTVTAPDGTQGTIPASQVEEARKKGYKISNGN